MIVSGVVRARGRGSRSHSQGDSRHRVRHQRLAHTDRTTRKSTQKRPAVIAACGMQAPRDEPMEGGNLSASTRGGASHACMSVRIAGFPFSLSRRACEGAGAVSSMPRHTPQAKALRMYVPRAGRIDRISCNSPCPPSADQNAYPRPAALAHHPRSVPQITEEL